MFKEIYECLPDKSVIDFVSLAPKDGRQTPFRLYTLHIKMHIHGSTIRENIVKVVKKHNLEIKESRGHFVIFAPQKTLEINA